MKIENLGVARALAITFGVVGAALIGVTVFVTVHLGSIGQRDRDASERLVPQLTRVLAIELNLTRVSMLARHAMLVRTPQDLAATIDEIGAKRRLIEEATEGFRANVRSERGQTLLAKFRECDADFWKIASDNLAMTRAGRKDEAFDHLVGQLIPSRNRLLAVTEELRDFQKALLADQVIASEKEADATQFAVVGLSGLVIVALGLSAWVLTRYLKRRVAQACVAAERIAAGDLVQTVQLDGRDEFRPLFERLGAMHGSLRRMVGDVLQSTDSITTASQEIATGNQDLSVRTEHTASNLQQTASSMEQLTGTVKQTAESARTANQLASSAQTTAAKGGEVVAQVVTTMDEINASSKKIADIIGVIDGIAFQTNILALNAAVEAARAGEQGRGFAVVAGEVRSLAQRSAQAAKEIKDLIGASVEKVESGSKLVADAGQTMSEIVASVQRVSDIINEITAAAAEQSEGIGQVNHAVNSLDQMTQQNAALVEQSAAAAASLKDQAAQLSASVSAFRIAA